LNEIGSETIEIRRLLKEDIPEIAAFRVRYLNEVFEHPEDEESRRLEQRISDFLSKHMELGDMYCYIACSSNRIVGSVCMMIRQSPPVYELFEQGNLGYLMNIHTIEEFRGRGITKDLIQKVIELAGDLGIDYIHLHCTEDMTRFYSKLGFSEVTAREMRMVLR
jgi:ribosomal protein S18 acetylase RimI-like enzyme